MNNSVTEKPLTGIKALYIVTAEDPLSTPKIRVYGTTKFDKAPGYVEISSGYNLSNLTQAQLEQLKTYEDAVELSKQGGLELVNIIIPWNRIFSIKNVSFAAFRSKAQK